MTQTDEPAEEVYGFDEGPTALNFDYEKFFEAAKGWVFQAANINPQESVSIGSMEWMYQAFKARMKAELEKG